MSPQVAVNISSDIEKVGNHLIRGTILGAKFFLELLFYLSQYNGLLYHLAFLISNQLMQYNGILRHLAFLISKQLMQKV
jgi:hypothetical protein